MQLLTKQDRKRWFLAALSYLIDTNVVKNDADFCRLLSFHQSSLTQIRDNKRGVSDDILSKMQNYFANELSDFTYNEGAAVNEPVAAYKKTPPKIKILDLINDLSSANNLDTEQKVKVEMLRTEIMKLYEDLLELYRRG